MSGWFCLFNCQVRVRVRGLADIPTIPANCVTEKLNSFSKLLFRVWMNQYGECSSLAKCKHAFNSVPNCLTPCIHLPFHLQSTVHFVWSNGKKISTIKYNLAYSLLHLSVFLKYFQYRNLLHKWLLFSTRLQWQNCATLFWCFWGTEWKKVNWWLCFMASFSENYLLKWGLSVQPLFSWSNVSINTSNSPA